MKSDGATRFSEVAGGLNQITIRRFEQFVDQSPIEFSRFELVPIRQFQSIHNLWIREFTTAIVRCHLVKRTAMKQDQSPAAKAAAR